MGNVTMMGWDADAKVWRKVLVNAEGKLIIDPTEIFEYVPTEDEQGKAPTSGWAFDHKADASAHHVKFTAADARASIGNIFNSVGAMLKDLVCSYWGLYYISFLQFKKVSDDGSYMVVEKAEDGYSLNVYAANTATGSVPSAVNVTDGVNLKKLATEDIADSKISTHAGNVSAHHSKYTNAEALAAAVAGLASGVSDVVINTGTFAKKTYGVRCGGGTVTLDVVTADVSAVQVCVMVHLRILIARYDNNGMGIFDGYAHAYSTGPVFGSVSVDLKKLFFGTVAAPTLSWVGTGNVRDLRITNSISYNRMTVEMTVQTFDGSFTLK